jgi:chromosome segregation ATPase
MSTLDYLKTQLEIMNNRINAIEKEKNEKGTYITKLETEINQLQQLLETEKLSHSKLSKNYDYLLEVKMNTTESYNQIEEAATTLCDILKNKCDGV